MQHFTQFTSLMGKVTQIHLDQGCFEIVCRSGDNFRIHIASETVFRVLENLDGVNRDRVPNPQGEYDYGKISDRLRKYVQQGSLIVVQGVYQNSGNKVRFDAKFVHLLHARQGLYIFEDTHWWLTQIARLADEWLDDLFGDRRTYRLDDFAELYHTNLNILGLPTDDNIQEMATLSRLIYGLSSAYLLTGVERFLLAAKAGVEYQRETFRSLSHDGKYCFWAFGRKRGKYGSTLIMASQNPDDDGTLPLYEQIYAIAGLTQYYRITNEWEVLEDIRRTVNAFNDFYLDDAKPNDKFPERRFPGHRGYFSHLDPATMVPDTPQLDRSPGGRNNRAKKNWNSIGDHIPAYLVNLVLALDPISEGRAGDLTE